MKRQKKSPKTLVLNIQPIGRPKVITDEYITYLGTLVKQSPQAYGYPFKRWTAGWLRCHLAKELRIEVSDRHINRLLHQMGLSTRNGDSISPVSNGISNDISTEISHASEETHRPTQILIQDLNPSAVPEFQWPFD